VQVHSLSFVLRHLLVFSNKGILNAISPFSNEKSAQGQVLVALTCNPSYLGGRDQEDHSSIPDHSSKPAQANSSQDPISKILFTEKGWWSGSRCRP
jgi:hypothetical protein